MCKLETETSRFGRVLRRRFWIRNLKWILCIRMNVLGLTDECKDLWIFSLRSGRWFTPREGNTRGRKKAALLNLLSSFLPLARARLSSRFLCSPWTGACYVGIANLNLLKCNKSASGKISPTGFVQFKNFIFKAWKFMEFNCQSLKIMEIIVLFGRLVTADDKVRVT